ncbi:hypothetical protein SLS62_007918 [Diatrype stigma]|uniref:Uncharacterized protein n=1 Tax=Diatrype stigma TaxID=117547 RepID=A0AAN9YPW4_9PEZI
MWVSVLVRPDSEMVVRVQLVVFHDEGTEDALSGGVVVSGAVPVPVPVAAVTLYVVEQVSVGVIHSSVQVELDGYGGAVTKGVPLALPLGAGRPPLGELVMGGDPEPELDSVEFGNGHSVVTEADSSDVPVGAVTLPPLGIELGDVAGTVVELRLGNGGMLLPEGSGNTVPIVTPVPLGVGIIPVPVPLDEVVGIEVGAVGDGTLFALALEFDVGKGAGADAIEPVNDDVWIVIKPEGPLDRRNVVVPVVVRVVGKTPVGEVIGPVSLASVDDGDDDTLLLVLKEPV